MSNIPSSLEWRLFDAQLTRQTADDMALIEERGRPDDFFEYLAERLLQEFGEGGFTDAHDATVRDERRFLDPLPGERLARRALGKLGGVDGRTITAALMWHHHRRRLRFIAAETRAEAERIRAELARSDADDRQEGKRCA